MAKSENDKPSEPEHIDTTLDTVLITALQKNFEIKSGYHVDRNEILEFLRAVIKEHPELNFVLQHRDTKLSSRIYKAFPKVTTKRVAVPNIRGKKIWTYTNLRRITGQKGSQPKQDVKSHKTKITRAAKNEQKEISEAAKPSNIMPSTKREKRLFKSKRSVQSASMVHRDSLFETYKRENRQKSSRSVGNVPQQSYLGRFNDMLKWVKEHYILDENSSIQVKHIVESIKTEFKINITYKQSHKLIFAVFPGTTSRVEHPVKIEAMGGFYSYKGIAPRPERGCEQEEPIVTEMNHSPPKSIEPQNVTKSINTRQTWVPPGSSGSLDDGRKRIFRTRKRFIEACAVLKPAEEALASPASHDVSPMTSDILHKTHGITPKVSDASPRLSDVSPRLSDEPSRFSEVSPRLYDASPRFSELSPRLSEVSPRLSDTTPRIPELSPRFSKVTPSFYELPPMISEDFRRRENNWQRLYEESKQERDQAIVERNQAMVTLMEIEREQTTRTSDNLPRRQPTNSDVVPSITRILPKSEDRGAENPDWLRSLISRSNSILGEQMSEANAVYFPGSTLQSSNCNQRYPKRSGDYLEIERYEQLKQERDAIWKNCIDKLRTDKDDIIQQLKLDKMEVIQRMELEKSDAVECIEEKLTNQITILTREMRELKELLNHTMNERTLAIEHAHKLMELVGEEKLKEAALDNFPFDVTNDHVVHLPKQNSTDETENQKLVVCFGKSNKRRNPFVVISSDENERKQSMPAKLKKIPRLDSSVSTESEKLVSNIPSHQTVSTDSENLLSDDESSYLGPDTDNGNTVATDIGITDTIDNVAIDNLAVDSRASDNGAIDNGSIDNRTIGNITIDNDTNDQSIMVSPSPVIDPGKVLRETDTTYTPPLKNSLAFRAESSTAAYKQPRSVSAEKQTIANISMNVLESESVSTEISKKLESPGTEDSNMDISEKSDNTFASSNSENIDDGTSIIKAEATNSKSQIDNSGTVNSNASSGSEKVSQKNLRNLNTSVNSISGKCSTTENLGSSPKLPSTANSEKHFTGTSTTNFCNVYSNYENFAADSQQSTGASNDNSNFPRKSEALVSSNTQKYFSETSGNYSPFTSNSGKYLRELPQPFSANSNFPKYLNEIPRTVLNTEVQKVNPAGVPGTISTCPDSELVTQESPKSFEESVNSTFLKYFPELPKSSLNSPLTTESNKYFRDIPRTVCSSVSSDPKNYIKDPGNQALVYPDEESFPEKSKVSSIDFLNSMVENIGKPSVE